MENRDYNRISQQHQTVENIAHSTSRVLQQHESNHVEECAQIPIIPSSLIVVDHEKF